MATSTDTVGGLFQPDFEVQFRSIGRKFQPHLDFGLITGFAAFSRGVLRDGHNLKALSVLQP
jgi:hypothetical protein